MSRELTTGDQINIPDPWWALMLVKRFYFGPNQFARYEVGAALLALLKWNVRQAQNLSPSQDELLPLVTLRAWKQNKYLTSSLNNYEGNGAKTLNCHVSRKKNLILQCRCRKMHRCVFFTLWTNVSRNFTLHKMVDRVSSQSEKKPSNFKT